MPEAKQRALALSGIILIKLGKGVIFLLVAWAAYAFSDNDLPAEYHRLLHWSHLNPERQFFSHLAVLVGRITEANVLWVAAGTLAYSLFSLIEGVGLFLRQRWASWMAIGESGFFIPLEFHELCTHFTWTVLIILVINVFICVYLLKNRKRLFHRIHFHFHHAQNHVDPAPRL
jgi:uncharacterized membrane protein (DUF2068 family)